MIRFTENREDIIKIWKEAFGDSDEEIDFFINYAEGAECLAYYDNNEIKALLYLVDCIVEGVKGKYIYAACTLKSERCKGIMTKLLNYSFSLGYCFVCLIPADEKLKDYYIKRGFNKEIEIKSIVFNQTEEIKDYLFEGYNLTKPIALIHKGE